MKKILVIEDELSVRENLVELLEAEGFQVFSTDNGILALLWAEDNLPDLIICDVMMPEIDGYEVLEGLRQIPMRASIPFIFLTAMADKADIRYGMELGADDYLTKPFTREELLRAITSRLSKYEIALQEYEAQHQWTETRQ
ncbi:response regulator transcription factor [Gloeothece verrucosa]|uniref:Response regulator receiver protein n=1 Tax=Gloeothece verrucosa (strain PCC 7822) TaxID=497965 RepID=E0UB78_GLOV7|nr:response regulator [Gloeothece verrucosa]ADN16323.1 response regulator receiver protein [Gloeothece verrucosa PCC 7822]